MTRTATHSWRIPLSRPDLNGDDRRAVAQVLDSHVLSMGDESARLEEEFSARLDGLSAAVVSSGSAGLYLALRALGVRDGEVITPSYGFIGTAHAIRLAGAEPRFADIERDTLCVSAETLEKMFSPSTRAVLPVHIFGTPAPMDEILDLASGWGVPVIEDACEALGSSFCGRPAGTLGDAGVFAFYPNKQMTTGEGGLVVARDPELLACVKSMSNQGRGEGEFQFVREGFNFRMTELQAALGRTQLKRLDGFLARRQRLAQRYGEGLSKLQNISVLGAVASGAVRSWFVYPVFL
ncbi:MAG: DegT/DnrJ/EryC1/StrS family aminotransferase, partial [Planctomycetota bacterium]